MPNLPLELDNNEFSKILTKKDAYKLLRFSKYESDHFFK